MKQDNLPLEQMTRSQIERINDPNTPAHVRRYLLSIRYPNYTEQEKKKGMNNKDYDWITKYPMMMWIVPALTTIFMGSIPLTVMAIFE